MHARCIKVRFNDSMNILLSVRLFKCIIIILHNSYIYIYTLVYRRYRHIQYIRVFTTINIIFTCKLTTLHNETELLSME